MEKELLKVYKYPLKVSKTQDLRLKAWSCGCRFLWNRSLKLRDGLYKRYKIYIDYFGYTKENERTKGKGLNKRLTTLRNRHEWLRDCPSVALQEILRDQDKAYKNFIRNLKKNPQLAGKPKFKHRGCFPRLFFPKSCIKFEYCEKKRAYLKIPKLSQLRVICEKSPLDNPKNTLSSSSLVFDDNRWFLCLLIRSKVTIPERKQDTVALHMGVVNTCTLSNGSRYQLDKDTIRKLRKKIDFLNNKLSMCIGSKKGEKKSKNWLKLKKQIDKLQRKIADIRCNFNHHVSKEIAQKYGTVIIEDLDIRKQTKSASGTKENPGKKVKVKSKINKYVLEQGWGYFHQYLTYKCDKNNAVLEKVPTYYNSTTCSSCGYENKANRVNLTKFKCLKCHSEKDADKNAAKNNLNVYLNKQE